MRIFIFENFDNSLPLTSCLYLHVARLLGDNFDHATVPNQDPLRFSV